MRRRRDRDMALSGHEAGGRVEADPARAGQVDLGPGVQVGEIVVGAGRSVERLHVRAKLNEIARHEAGRQAEVAQDFHQKPRRIAARAGRRDHRLLRRLHAGLHPDDVADFAAQAPIELDQEIDSVARLPRNSVQERLQAGAKRLLRLEIGGKLLAQLGRERKREFVGIGFDEEVERVDDFEVGEEVDRHREFGGLFRENETGDPVAVRVLLPVHEMLGRRHRERIARHAGAGVRRRSQPDGLRPETDRTAVLVTGGVMKTCENGHWPKKLPR